VALPEAGVGKSVVELATMMWEEHYANVLAVNRNGKTVANPPPGFLLQSGDDLVILANELGDLTPIEGRVQPEPAPLGFEPEGAPATA
jgi:hypothetical protein